MSNYLSGLNQLNPQVKRHNGGTATLTLDSAGTSNATMLYVNGVAQTPGVDFNVSGSTLTCTSTLPAGTNIATTIQYFSTGVVNVPSDSSVTLAKMATGVVAVPHIEGIAGNIITGLASNLTITLTNHSPDIDVVFKEGGTTVATVTNQQVDLGSVVVAVPSAVYGQTTGDTITITVLNSSGIVSDNSVNKTVVVAPGLQANPASSLSSLLSDRGWTDGSATEGVYWFNNGTNTFPNVIKNISGNTWLLLQKNFVPHAYKGGDSNSGSALSYGLMNSSGNAIITTAIDNNTTPSSSTLGVNHARMSVTGWATSSFSVLGAYDSGDSFRTYSAAAADLHALIVLGQANNNTFVSNTVYTMSGGSNPSTMYLVFNTNFNAGDGDAAKMSMTEYNDNTQDRHNTAAEFHGVSWFQDGGTAYTTTNADSNIQGATQGDFSFWVR
ncbi:MAG: hypothetical protein CMD09_01370 [Flavobacteriales bacterium]|nr:hypothetical protein [Flavobacteriales bacterium]OUW96971.1 MAG: hypothetical protein CBD88_03045 [Flavobacteriales bacterium TMED228]|tara:strand:- start:763 stop:2082 length:1320 start_codon:yes stop_codon:yes gene_type:complete